MWGRGGRGRVGWWPRSSCRPGPGAPAAGAGQNRPAFVFGRVGWGDEDEAWLQDRTVRQAARGAAEEMRPAGGARRPQEHPPLPRLRAVPRGA